MDMDNDQNNTSSASLALTVFSGPCFGDESPSGSSMIAAAPTASSFNLDLNNDQLVEGSFIQPAEPTSMTPPLSILGSAGGDNQDSAVTAPSSTFERSASFIAEQESVLDFDSPPAQINSTHALHINGKSSESLEDNASNASDPIAHSVSASALPSPLQLLISDLETPKDNDINIFNATEESENSQLENPLLLSDLPTSSPPPEALIFLSASTPTASSLSVAEMTPLEESDPPHGALCDSSSFSRTDQASQPVQSIPLAPRLPLAALPELELKSEPLTSMHDLLTSLSQNQVSSTEFTTDKQLTQKEHENVPEDLPSSSPNESALKSSSPPSSSPCEIFSSSPLEVSPLYQSVFVANRHSPPPAFLHRAISPHEGQSKAQQAEVPLNTAIISRMNQSFPSSSPPVSTPSVSAASSIQRNCQGVDHDLEPWPKASDQRDDGLMPPIPSSDDYLASDAFSAPMPVTSSPIPSSSPGDGTTLPSSSPPSSQLPMTLSSPPRKRKRDGDDEGIRSLPGSPARMRSARAPPAPKRSTIASQRHQQKKLTAPFKSPLMTKTTNLDAHARQNVPVDSVDVSAAEPASKVITTMLEAPPVPPSSKPPVVEQKMRYTVRAASQFKSPLSSGGVGVSVHSQVRLTPTIQALERKIQILKRALKVKKDNQEELLTDLTARWTEAGREVAWEVWQLTKNSENSSSDSWGSSSEKRPFQESWGWETQADEKRIKLEGTDSRDWSSTDETVEVATLQDTVKEEEEERVEYTMGLMLRRLGIDPATLGWDDKEGIFRDP